MATELADAPTRLSVTLPDSPTTSWASPSNSRGHSRNNSTLAAELEEGQKETRERVARLSEDRMRQRMAEERKNLHEKLGRSPTAAAAAPDDELQVRLRQQLKDKMAAQMALVSPSTDVEAARAQRMKEREASLLREMAQVRPDGAPLDVALDTAALLSDTSEGGSLRGSFDLPASGTSNGTHSRKGSEVPNLGTLAEEGGGGSGAESAHAGGKSGGSTSRSRVGGDEAADGANVRDIAGGGGGDDDDDDGEAKKARRRRKKKLRSGAADEGGDGGDRGDSERMEGVDEWTSASSEEEEEEEREPTVSDAVAMLPDLTWAKERMRMYNEMDGLPPEPEEQELTEEPAVAATAVAVVPGEHDEAVKRMGRLLLAEDFFAEAEKLLKGKDHAGNSRLYLERKHVRDNARASFDQHIAELEVDMQQARETLLSPTTQLAMLSPESSMAESSRPKSGKSSRPNSSRPSSAGGPRGLVTFVDDEEYVDLMQESGDLNELSAADGRSASPSPERDSSSGAYDAMAGTQPSSGGGGGGLSALIAERKSERRKEMISVKEEASSRSLGHVDSSQSIGDLDDSSKSRQPSKASSRQLTPTGSPPVSAHRDPLAAMASGVAQQQHQQQQHAHRRSPSPAVQSPDALRSQLNSRGGMGGVGGMGRMSRKAMPHLRPGTAPEGPAGGGGGGTQLGLGEPYRPITAPMLETSESSLVWESSSFEYPSVPHTPYTNAGGSVGFYPSSMLERQAARDEMRLLLGSARTFRNRHHQKRLPPSKIQQAVDRLTRDDIAAKAMQELAAESSARELAELAATRNRIAPLSARSLPKLNKSGALSGRAVPKGLTDTTTTRAKIPPPPEPLLSAPAMWEPVVKPRTPSVRLRMSYIRDGGGYRETLSPIQPLTVVSQQQMTKRLYDDSLEAAAARAAHAKRVASTRFRRPPTSAPKKRGGSGKARG